MHRFIRTTCGVVIALTLGLALAIAKPAGKDEKDYQAKTDTMPWKFAAKAASAAYAAQKLPKPFEADISAGQFSGTISLKKADKAAYQWDGHGETVFIVTDDVLYYSDHHQASTGCQVIAIDLTTGKQLWKTRLKGLGPISHFRYRNQVNLDLEDRDTLRIFGRESAGGYVELVDRKTGKTVGNRKYKGDEIQEKDK
jgi:hypothetical protein